VAARGVTAERLHPASRREEGRELACQESHVALLDQQPLDGIGKVRALGGELRDLRGDRGRELVAGLG
jgi:hypothetical protein